MEHVSAEANTKGRIMRKPILSTVAALALVAFASIGFAGDALALERASAAAEEQSEAGGSAAIAVIVSLVAVIAALAAVSGGGDDDRPVSP